MRPRRDTGREGAGDVQNRGELHGRAVGMRATCERTVFAQPDTTNKNTRDVVMKEVNIRTRQKRAKLGT